MTYHEFLNRKDKSPPPVALAPMAGYTDAAMRKVCSERGAAWSYTEMTNGYGLLREEEKTWHLLETFEDEREVVAHLYGNHPDVMGEATAKVAETGRFFGIDLNAGCPVHKVMGCGAGAALIKTPELFHDILAAMVKATQLPVTVKTRLGPAPDKIAAFELLAAAEAAGAKAVTIHGRFTSQRHSGAVHFDLLAEVKQRAQIPVIINGGIYSPNTAWDAWQATGCDGIMVARAAIGNPWIFSEINRGLSGDSAPVPEAPPGQGRSRRGLDLIRAGIMEHLALERELIVRIRDKYQLPESHATPDEALAAAFRLHMFRYLHGLQGSGHLRRHLMDIQSESDIITAVTACLDNEAEFRRNHPAFITQDS